MIHVLTIGRGNFIKPETFQNDTLLVHEKFGILPLFQAFPVLFEKFPPKTRVFFGKDLYFLKKLWYDIGWI